MTNLEQKVIELELANQKLKFKLCGACRMIQLKEEVCAECKSGGRFKKE